jgi:hypothetical protein
MHVRCQYCSHSFTLSRDYIAQAVAEAAGKRQKYHAVECINCRKLIRVSMAQMKRFVPASPPTEVADETTVADTAASDQ